ncbi:hypothetical protein KY347_04150 [Candidatus Woesearchaeota archaeon]|nr:hypothetical protein [Candidatus Woesearchaeota archaeon]
MKKAILALLIIAFLLLTGCNQNSKESAPEEIYEGDYEALSELQVAACDAADEAGTCQTRMVEVGIVMPDKCCEVLGKCCGNE